MEEQRKHMREPIRKQVGGSLSNLDTFDRLKALYRNATALLGDSWKNQDDGTLVRKVVGKTN